MTLHYSTPDTSPDKTFFAVVQDGPGWTAVAWPETPGVMIGSDAVIYTPGENNPIQVYDLTSKAPAGVVVSNDAFVIDDIEEIPGGFVFSRAASADFDPTATQDMLLARHSTTPGLTGAHSERSAVVVPLTGGEAIEAGSDPTNEQTAHGVLMTLGWGVFIPLGIVMANSLRFKTPFWFHCHRVLQTLGLILALAGFILAIKEFDISGTDTLLGKHRIIGIVVMAAGLF